jgi:hypothetical protein
MPSSAESPLLRRDPDVRNFALRRNRSLHSLARRGARPRLATLYSIAAIAALPFAGAAHAQETDSLVASAGEQVFRPWFKKRRDLTPGVCAVI